VPLVTIGAPRADSMSARVTLNPQQMPDIRLQVIYPEKPDYRSVLILGGVHIRRVRPRASGHTACMHCALGDAACNQSEATATSEAGGCTACGAKHCAVAQCRQEPAWLEGGQTTLHVAADNHLPNMRVKWEIVAAPVLSE
jgi:hypothetical protein